MERNNLILGTMLRWKRLKWLDRRIFLHFGVDEIIGDGENRVIELKLLNQSFHSFIFSPASCSSPALLFSLPSADHCLLLITRNGSWTLDARFFSSTSSRMSNTMPRCTASRHLPSRPAVHFSTKE